MEARYEFFDYTCFLNSFHFRLFLQKRDIRRYADHSHQLKYQLNMYLQFKVIFTSDKYPYPPPGNVKFPLMITLKQVKWMRHPDVPDDVSYMFYLSKGRC